MKKAVSHFKVNNQNNYHNLKKSLSEPSWPSFSSPLKEMMGGVLNEKSGLLTTSRALWRRALLLTWM